MQITNRRKKGLNLSIDIELVDELNEICDKAEVNKSRFSNELFKVLLPLMKNKNHLEIENLLLEFKNMKG